MFNKYSPEFSDMLKLFGMTTGELTKLSDEEMCNRINISECLKPSAPGSVTGTNEQDKAALLDFYKNTTLINPCTGDDIDKDAIFMDLCESGEVSVNGLDAALDEFGSSIYCNT